MLLEGFRYGPTQAFFAPLAWMVLVNSVGGFALLFVLIRRGAASAVAALFFLMPAVTAVLGHLMLGEHITALKLSGFACAAIGVWMATGNSRIATGDLTPDRADVVQRPVMADQQGQAMLEARHAAAW